MEQINEFIDKISSIEILDILIALGIIIFFRVFSGSFSYIIVKLFKIKAKTKKDIKESAFYKPLKVFFIIFGIYLAAVFLKRPLNIDTNVMQVITKGFQVIAIIAFANGLANSFTQDSKVVNQLKKKMNKEVSDNMFEFILKLIRVLIYIVAGFIVITFVLGINLNGLIAGLGISGVILTLAAQDTAKNLIGGLVIFIDKPFVVGDCIEMENYEGTIEDITFRTTRIRTYENALLNIPNSIIADAAVINWSKMEKRRYKTNLCLELDIPLEKLELLKEKIKKMLESRESVYDDSIIVKFDKITESGINVLIYTYTDSVDYTSYLSEVEDINMKIMKILREENVKLAYDTKTVYIKN